MRKILFGIGITVMLLGFIVLLFSQVFIYEVSYIFYQRAGIGVATIGLVVTIAGALLPGEIRAYAICPKCRMLVNPESPFCSECGAELKVKFP